MKKLIVFSFMSLIVFLMLCGRIVADDGMNPSLHDGDITIVLPLQPKIGDIVAVKDPLNPNGGEVFRRVLALGEMDFSYDRNGSIMQNNRRITQKDMGVFGSHQAIEERFESGDGTIKKWVIMRLIEPVVFSVPEQTVASGHVFLIADQRDEGLDSRIWGAIPEEWITGVVSLRLGKVEPWGSWATWRP